MTSLLYKQEAYNSIRVCMEVHKELGLFMNFGEDCLTYKRVILLN